MRKDFLLEIGVEEMPAGYLPPALEQLKELGVRLLGEHRLPCGEVFAYGTPRRLVLYVKELAAAQEPVVKEVKGPAAKVAFDGENRPTRAALGFARSQGVDVRDLVVKPVGAVDYVFAVIKEQGRPAPEVLPGLCHALVSELHFPKYM
ncbi:MAG: glycine--tRNA ligase subunit beta, partial [Desulfotomaculales bacterium]